MRLPVAARLGFAAVAGAMLLLACGQPKGSGAGARAAKPELSPGEVVQTAMTAANGGRFSRVEELSSRQLQTAIQTGTYAGLGGTKGVWDWITRGRAVKELRILNQSTQDDVAGVAVARYVQGETEPRLLYFRLVREDGSWKVADFGEEDRFRELLKYRD